MNNLNITNKDYTKNNTDSIGSIWAECNKIKIEE